MCSATHHPMRSDVANKGVSCTLSCNKILAELTDSPTAQLIEHGPDVERSSHPDGELSLVYEGSVHAVYPLGNYLQI